MVLALASQFTELIARTGYFGLFFLMTGESALMPIPSEIVLPFAGFLIYSGKMTFFLAVFIAVLGQLFGSIISYCVGYYGGRPFVLKYGKYFHLSEKKFVRVDNWFKKYGPAAILFGRLLPIVRTVISFPAGIAKMNFKKFLLYSTLGIVPWTIFLIYVGFKLGNQWQSIIATFDEFQYVVIAGIIIFVVWWIHKELKERKRIRKHETQTTT